ncbi:MAG: hypothetical protein GY851_18030 [bacterium]|nr:hypothetical protein [bacterium]
MRKSFARGVVWCVLSAVVLVGVSSVAHGQDGNQWLAVQGAVEGQPLDVAWSPLKAGAGTEVTIDLPGVYKRKVTNADGVAFDGFSVPGCGATANRVGEPELPVKGFWIEVPHGVDVSVEISDEQFVSLGTDYVVSPHQPPQPDSPRKPGSEPDFAFDGGAYAKDTLYPTKSIESTGTRIWRGRRVVFVKVALLRYNPLSGEVWAVSHCCVTVGHSGTPDAEAEADKARLASPYYEPMLESFILNYTPPEATKSDDSIHTTGQGADYLIICRDDFVDAVTPLAEWKQRKGLLTRIATLSETGSTFWDIRAYLEYTHANWSPVPSYLLLVGDAEVVPSGFFDADIVGMDYTCTSDYMYCFHDSISLGSHSLMHIPGRLPVSTPEECTTVVDRILAYDSVPAAGDWYANALTAGFFQDNDDNGVADRWFMETVVRLDNFISFFMGTMTTHRAWCTNSGTHADYHYRSDSYPHRATPPDPVPAGVVSSWTGSATAAATVTSTVNAGVGLVQHRDHGSETAWGDPYFSATDVQSLTNGAMTPVVFSINCLTGSFHRTGGDSFCEAFLKNPNGGAVGIAGATRVSYSGYNDALTNGIYTCLWPIYDVEYTGHDRLWNAGFVLEFAKHYQASLYALTDTAVATAFMFHWFGDPEMQIRLNNPYVLAVSHTTTVPVQEPTGVLVNVQFFGSPVANADVCVSHPTAPGQHWTTVTNADGVCGFGGLVFTKPGDYHITVSGKAMKPYLGTIVASLGSDGFVDMDRSVYGTSDTVSVDVGDADLAGNGTQSVTIASSGGDSETLSLAEDGGHLGLFTATIATATGAPAADGVLQVADGDTITATYEDADTGSGTGGTKEDTATVDGTGPVISNVEVVGATTSTARIAFDTDIPTTARIRYGTSSAGPYPMSQDHPALTTSHLIALTRLSEATPYWFVVDAWDEYGNPTTDDNGGAGYVLSTQEQVYYFPLDTSPGWTMEGQWQFGTPGGGGSYNGDPTSGHTGVNVYGYNLAGDYPNDMAEEQFLTTGAIDCSGLSHVSVRFWRWLGVENRTYDDARVWVRNEHSALIQVWHNPDEVIDDGEWVECEYDISEWADGQSTVYIRWAMGPTDDSTTYAGWNIDDISIYAAFDDPNAPRLSVTPESRSVACTAGSTTFSVANLGVDPLNWTATTSSPGFTVEAPASGTDAGTVTVSFTQNNGASPRIGTITVTAPGAIGSPVNVTVEQDRFPPPELDVTPASHTVGNGSGSRAFTIQNTGPGTLNWSAAADVPWLTVQAPASGTDTGTITVAYEANVTSSPRTGGVTVTAPGADNSPMTVYIAQAGLPQVAVTPASRSVGYAAGSTSFSVQNAGGGILHWSAAANDPWLSVLPTSGTGNATLTVNFSENLYPTPRMGSITVTGLVSAYGPPVTVQVTQGANSTLVVSVTPMVREVAAETTSTTFGVQNAGGGIMNWTASMPYTEWAGITSGASGQNTGTVGVALVANPTIYDRSTTVTVTATGAQGSPKTATLTQNGRIVPWLSVTPLNTTTGYTASVPDLIISNIGTATMPWSLVSTAGWLTVSGGTSGVNNAVLGLNIAENPWGTPRTGQIVVTAPGAIDSPRTLTVTQSGNTTLSMAVAPMTREVSAAEGTTLFTVSNTGSGNMAWSAECTTGLSWLSIQSGGAGMNTGSVVVHMDANPGDAERVGTLTVSATNCANSPCTLTVRQGCAPPAQPSNVTASAGTFPDRVRLTWNAVTDATQYCIYRNSADNFATASKLGLWSQTTFDDFSCTLPTTPTADSGGCGSSGGGSSTAATSHRYWVTAINSCGEGEPCGCVTGNAGKTLSADATKSIRPAALPAGDGAPVRRVPADGAVYVRLTHDAAIDPATVQAQVATPASSAPRDVPVVWAPVADSDRDGWTGYWPASNPEPGTTFTLTARARTVTGEDVIHAESFLVDPKTSATGVTASQLTVAKAHDAPPPFVEGMGEAYQVGPGEVYDPPRTIRIPVPADAAPDDVNLFYYQPTGEDQGWYAGRNVDGWLVQDSVRMEDDGADAFLVCQVRHGGTVRLGSPVRPEVASAEVVPAPATPGWGGTILLLLLPLFLVVYRRRAMKRE